MKIIVRARKKPQKPYMTPKEVGQLLGVSDMMVRVSLKQNAPGWDFPYVMSGRNCRIPRAAFMEWFRGREV